jgi:hypothetical protein
MVDSARSVFAGAVMTEQGVTGGRSSYGRTREFPPVAILRRVRAVIRGRGVVKSII